MRRKGKPAMPLVGCKLLTATIENSMEGSANRSMYKEDVVCRLLVIANSATCNNMTGPRVYYTC